MLGGGTAVDNDRVPPGQTVTQKFPVLSYGQIPTIDLATWTFEVIGLVDNPVSFTWDQFIARANDAVTADFHCVTGWSRLDNEWQGVFVRDLFDEARIRPTATHVMAHCYGGYTTNMPLVGAAQSRRADRIPPRWSAVRAGARRPRAPNRSGPLRLQERQVDQGPGTDTGEQARLLGIARLQLQRRPMEKGALRLLAPATRHSRSPPVIPPATRHSPRHPSFPPPPVIPPATRHSRSHPSFPLPPVIPAKAGIYRLMCRPPKAPAR